MGAIIWGWWELLWCVEGDFNAVHYPTERLGVETITTALQELLDLIFIQPYGYSCGGRQFHSLTVFQSLGYIFVHLDSEGALF